MAASDTKPSITNASSGPVPVVMITLRTTEAAICKAFGEMESDGHIDRPPKIIRIEGM